MKNIEISPTQCLFQLSPQSHVSQESSNQRILCASVVLDQKPDPLQQHLATAVYESCRSGELVLQGFPDYDGPIQRMKDSKTESPAQEYQVTAKRGNNLVVLAAYCNKWLESEQFKTDAKAVIEQHNSQYNNDGDFVEEESRFGLGSCHRTRSIKF